MNSNSAYWYVIRMVYLLSKPIIGHTEPTVAERWEFTYRYANAREPNDLLPDGRTWIQTLEEELWDEGIPLPLVDKK